MIPPDHLDDSGDAAWHVHGGRIHVAHDGGAITITGINGATLTADATHTLAETLESAQEYSAARSLIATITTAAPFENPDVLADEHYITAVRNQLARRLDYQRDTFAVSMSADDGICWWIIPTITIVRFGRTIQQIMWTADEGWGVIYADDPERVAFANIHEPRPSMTTAAQWIHDECTGDDTWS